MDPTFLALLILVVLVVWTSGIYFFGRISRENTAKASSRQFQPVLRLAEQWIADSQKRVEELIQKSEQPLSTAQNELLELRLEASRLPQGVKNLKQIRESLLNPISPSALPKSLVDIVRLYLNDADFGVIDPSLVCLKTSLGEMPCVEIESQDSPLSESQMKTLLSQVSLSLNRLGPRLVAGGFVYFKNEQDYQACLGNPEWMQGLKTHRLMIMDFKGLTALLISLRLSGDVEKVCRTFEAGVQSTLGLAGQSDKMNEALSRLGANALKSRTILEGTAPSDLKPAQ